MQYIFTILLALTLSGCGGGGGGGGVKPPPVSPRGPSTLPGIERIPLNTIKITNARMAEYYTIAEFVPVDHWHANLVSSVARNSYITKGDDDPFTLIGISRERIGASVATAELMRQIPATTKIVSVSVSPRGDTFIELHGTSLPFIIINGTGNSGRENFFGDAVYDVENDRYYDAVYDPNDNRFETPDGSPVEEFYNTQWMNIRAAIEEDRVLYVAGHGHDDANNRHHASTGCTGVENGCLYAPYIFYEGGGTSVSTPNVASALASVLAVFPDTAGTELIRLARVCAVPVETLSGLGRADFTCMTTMDENGDWQLVSDSLFNSLINPYTMSNQVAVPGSISLSAPFSRPGEAEVITLGLTKQGTFDTAYSFYAGVPVQIEHSKDGEGFFPIKARSNNAIAVGGGYQTRQGFFVAGTFGLRDQFFGLGEQYGYGENLAIDLSAGHPNVSIRISNRYSDGTNHIIKSAKGSAIGLTATKNVVLTKALQMDLTANADRFITGSVNTVFGEARMDQGSWNHETKVDFLYRLSEKSTIAVSGKRQWLGNGTTDAEVMSTVNIRF